LSAGFAIGNFTRFWFESLPAHKDILELISWYSLFRLEITGYFDHVPICLVLGGQ
jgi:hypothetical protein